MIDSHSIDLLVVTHNSITPLRQLIKSLTAESPTLPSPLIVVDSGSSDTSGLRNVRGARVVLTDNYGFGTAANLGLRRSTADWIVLMNPDVTTTYSSIQALVGATADSGSVLGAPKIILPNGHEAPHPTDIPAPPWIGDPLSKLGLPSTTGPIALLGAMLAIHRQSILALGGFDERYFLYAEEIDLCLRARRAGHTLCYAPEVRVAHLGEQGALGVDPTWRVGQRIRGKATFHHKHFGALSAAGSATADIAAFICRAKPRPTQLSELLRTVLTNPRAGLAWPPRVNDEFIVSVSGGLHGGEA